MPRTARRTFGRRTFGIRVVGLLLIVAFVLGRFSLPRRPNQETHLGHQLRPCTQSPNCVSSQEAAESPARMEPIEFRGSREAAKRRLLAALATLPRLKVVAESENYLRVEATSRFLRFVDDVEFLIEEDGGTIHFRSASRTGYWDLGVNRARMARIRQAFAAATD